MPNCSRIYASLRSVLDMCHRHIAPSKAFVIRSFFSKNGYLLMLLAGQKVKTSLAGKPASKFRPFFPW